MNRDYALMVILQILVVVVLFLLFKSNPLGLS